ncbi:hypothetical protein BOTBODRAFT_192496, partial [Botryobasidium botryosum FD-172 SS1]
MISLDGLRLVVLFSPIVAVIVTCLRLFDRFRNRLLGHDDAWAFISMLFIVMLIVTWNLWLVCAEAPLALARVAIWYLINETFYAVIWPARISIVYCLVRVSPGMSEKRFLHIVVAIFIFFWVFLSAQLIWICEPQPSWKKSPFPDCPLGKQVAYSQLITSVFSDVLLMAWPIRMFWALKSSRGLRIRLMAIFSTSLVTSAVGLVQNLFLLMDEGPNQAVAAVVEATVGLIVCNLPIIVGAVYRLRGDSLEAAGGGWRTPNSNSIGIPHNFSIVRFGHGLSHGTGGSDASKPPTTLSDAGISAHGHSSLGTKSDSSARFTDFWTAARGGREGRADRTAAVEISVSSLRTHE